MNHKKTILYLTYSSGGPHVWAENLASEMEKRGWKTKVAWGYKNYLLSHFRKYDILHSAMPLLFSRSKKYILIIKGNYRKEYGLLLRFFPMAIKSADIVTTPSKYMKNELTITDATVIPNGIYLPKKFKVDYGLTEKNPTFGILTNFNFEPKAQGVLKLAKMLSKVAPEGKLVIGGSGQYFDNYKNWILKNYPGTVFLGHCQKENLFSKIDIFSYYSLLDNQPNALMEAMAYGLPVISNDIGAVREIMLDKISYYIGTSENDYSSKLQELIKSANARNANGQLARQTMENFRWDKIADQWEKIYNQ